MKELIEGEYLPQALAIGVEYSLFYSLNPRKLDPFIEAYRLKQENEMNMMYLTTWLAGQYVASAVNQVMSGTDYPKEPLSVDDTKGAETEEEQREKLRIKNEADAIKFGEFAELFNKGFRERGEK